MDIRRGAILGGLLAAALAGEGAGADREAGTSAVAAFRGFAAADLPASFETNLGQTDPSVRFLARFRGGRAFFTDAEAVLQLPRGTGARPDPRSREVPASPGADVVRMRLEGARSVPPIPLDPLPGRSHYLLGNDPAGWIRGVPHHGALVASGLLPGVDLRWRGLRGGRLAYDLLLAPGADPASAVLRWEGLRDLALDATGALVGRTGGGVLRHSPPVAWQVDGRRRLPVAASFALLGGERVGFRLGRLDPSLPTVIDPSLDYSTFLGGNNGEFVKGIAAGPAGTIIAVGQTSSFNFPTTGAFQPSKASNEDAYVTKVSATGSSLVYSTFLGGAGTDFAFDVAVAADGAATVCGYAEGTGFPTLNAFDGAYASARDGFLSRLSSDGSSLLFSTYLGGSSEDIALGVALASDGGAVVCGYTASTNFATTSLAYQTSAPASKNGFVLRTGADGSTLAWSTFLGGSSEEEALDIGVDPSGGILVAGWTVSADFPAVNAVQSYKSGSQDAFLSRLSADGSSLTRSTFFGGTSNEVAYCMSVDSLGRATIAGTTSSPDLPLVGAFQAAPAGSSEGFVARYSASGTSIERSTYLGGTGDDYPLGIGVDLDGAVAVVGQTSSLDFPLQLPIQGTRAAQYDAFVTMFQPSVAAPIFSTYLGGSGYDIGNAVAFDTTGRIVVGGYSNGATNTFPVQGAFQSVHGGVVDGFLSAFDRLPAAPQDVAAVLVDLDAAELTWSDVGSGETGFRLERATDGINFTTRATVAADVLLHEDGDLAPATTYTYRIRSLSGSYASEPSGEVSVTTPPTPVSFPAAPTLLTATVVGPRRVDLAWQDNSDNEGFFQLARAEGAGLYATIATPRLGQTTRTDATTLPGRTYSWKVRAVNPVGPSLDSNVATATMPSTLEAPVAKGRLTDRDGLFKDAVTLSGTLAFGAEAEAAAYDPAIHDLGILLGPLDGDPLAHIPAGSPGWKERRGKLTWKSPKESIAKVKFTFVPATGAWTLASSRLTLSEVPGEEVRVTVTVDTDEGHHEAPWTAATKGGQRKYPVPGE
jgi:hypothetical protein